MYFIHNKYDRISAEMLETLPEGTIVIDLFSLRQRRDKTYGDMDKLKVYKIPCLLEQLEFMSEDEFPPRQPTEVETMQAKLDYLAMMAGQGCRKKKKLVK